MIEREMKERMENALLAAGLLAGQASRIDIEALQHALAVNPGLAFYLESIQATLNFINDLKRIQRERGSERLKMQVVPFGAPRDADGRPS